MADGLEWFVIRAIRGLILGNQIKLSTSTNLNTVVLAHQSVALIDPSTVNHNVRPTRFVIVAAGQTLNVQTNLAASAL